MSGAPLDALLAVDKPKGPTSHDVVERVRRVLGVRKAGHTGTLDPAATGVLVLCLGRLTRLSSFLTAHQKRYRARVHLGVTTDTLDAEGTVTGRSDTLPASAGEVARAAERFVGRIQQVPPMYSARRVEGRRLHELARAGKTVERQARPVDIAGIEVLGYTPPFADLDVRCGPGTYIRTLADDLGRALGCGGHLCDLRRTEVGRVGLDDCVALVEVSLDTVASRMIDPSAALADLPEARLDGDALERFARGGAVPFEAGHSLARVTDAEGRLWGLGRSEGGLMRPERVIRDVEAGVADAHA